MATSTFPPPPTSDIDWDNVGFKVREVNGHIESTYNLTTQQWSKPAFVKDPFLRIHGMAPGLNYGQQCYEGQKAFRTPTGSISIFRPAKNAQRMSHSASTISMPSIPQDHFLACVHLAVSLNAEFVPPADTGAAMYIRPLLFGSSAQLGLNPPEEYTFVVYVMPTGVYHGIHAVDALILEDFDRSAPEGTGSAKVGGNYAPVLRFSERARREGFGITLHLDSRTRGEIDEFSTSGFVGVKEKDDGSAGKTVVVPDSKQIIDSVTSDSVCQIAREIFGWTVEKRPIPYEELGSFSEVMAAGTAAALVPIRSITMRSREDRFEYSKSDEPGEVCVKLLGMLKGIQSGREEDRFGWRSVVERPVEEKFVRRGAGGEGEDAGERTNGVGAGNVHKLP